MIEKVLRCRVCGNHKVGQDIQKTTRPWRPPVCDKCAPLEGNLWGCETSVKLVIETRTSINEPDSGKYWEDIEPTEIDLIHTIEAKRIEEMLVLLSTAASVAKVQNLEEVAQHLVHYYGLASAAAQEDAHE